MAGGFALAAFYILPAAWEQRWVQISQALTENLRPAQNFLFTHSNDPEFVLFNWKVSAIALGTILIVALAAVFAARQRRNFLQLWWMLFALAAASAFLMFPREPFPLATSAKTSVRTIPLEMARPSRRRLRFFYSRNTANASKTMARLDSDSYLHWSARNRASEGRLVG